MCQISGNGGFGRPEVYCEKERKARKGHTCYECSGKILPGQTYVHVSGVWDGVGSSYAFCTACSAVMRAFHKAHVGACIELGNLSGALEECISEETSLDDDDNEVLTESGKRWQTELDGIRERGRIDQVKL